MERLTMWYDGNHAICENGECSSGNCPFADPICEQVQNIIDRLAAYEDTGLEPEEVRSQKELFDYLVFDSTPSEDIERFKRLRELAQADRLIGKTIYRPGDPIKQAYEWEVTMFEVYPDTIVLYDDSDNTFCLNDIGKTVFLTREEAEAALATDC